MSRETGGLVALIPACQEELRIGEVVSRALGQLGRVLVVDDGSTDGTAPAAAQAGAVVLRHEANRGKGEAIRTGLRHWMGTGDWDAVVLLDGDGQHLPEEIGRFAAVAGDGCGLWVGNRMQDTRRMPRLRRWTNRFMSGQVSALCGQAVPDSQCGFRMVHRDWVPLLLGCGGTGYDFESEMLVMASRAGCRIGAVPVTTVYGDETSKIRPVRDAVRFFLLVRRLGRKTGRSAVR
jgi:glycosyltransferase involved in cell wall biosynthesis